MKWSPQQDAALQTVQRWYRDPHQQVCRVFGFAGVGKTTLARHFAEGVDGTTLYGAYTGKAAHVLLQMGCVGATTIHSMIYNSKERGRAELRQLELQLTELREELRLEGAEPTQIEGHQRVTDILALVKEERSSLSQPLFKLNPDSAAAHADLIILDEVSMVDGRIGEDVLSFDKKVLVLGDPFQLPPVMGGGFFTDVEHPDVMLTEIHRQARDNPIIAMATTVREGGTLELGQYGESEVTDRRMEPEEVLAADQILVGRNKTRHACNDRVRSLLGRTEPLPVAEDKLVCLRNNHERGLLNGAIWHVTDIGYLGSERVHLSIRSDPPGQVLDVEAHTHHFLNKEERLMWWERKEAEEFDYGNALTVHKAQGSQYGQVLVFDESWCFRADRHRHLYTAITRASERVQVVRS